MGAAGIAGSESSAEAAPSGPLATSPRRTYSVAQGWAIAYQLARLDVIRRYTATMLGVVWAVLSPLLQALVIGVVFGRLFGVPVREFLPYLFLNLTLWAFLVSCLNGGQIAFVAAEGYIKQIPGVPLFAYPLRMALSALYTLALALLAVAIVVLAAGGRPGWTWLLVLPGLAAWFLFGLAVASLAAVANTAVRDLEHIQAVAVQALFYATPIMYPASLLADHGLAWMLTWNPVYHLLTLVYLPLLQGAVPSASHYLAAALSVALALALARAAMRRAEPRVAFWL